MTDFRRHRWGGESLPGFLLPKTHPPCSCSGTRMFLGPRYPSDGFPLSPAPICPILFRESGASSCFHASVVQCGISASAARLGAASQSTPSPRRRRASAVYSSAVSRRRLKDTQNSRRSREHPESFLSPDDQSKPPVRTRRAFAWTASVRAFRCAVSRRIVVRRGTRRTRVRTRSSRVG